MVPVRYKTHILIPRLDEIALQKFGANVPSTGHLEKLTKLAMVSSNPALDIPIPLAPNVIPVAGLHIKAPKKLPAEYEAFINASAKGAVLFSLGTNVRSDMMNEHKQQMLLDAFEQLPDYHFLWKFESDIQTPKNVMLRKWMPQTDLLAHEKVKAFFTHSGLLSTQEAVWYGVPMLGMPFIYDQHRVSGTNNFLDQFDRIVCHGLILMLFFPTFQNIHKCQLQGIAERISYPTLTTEEVVVKLRNILENPR